MENSGLYWSSRIAGVNAWWIQLIVINIIIRVIVSYLDCNVILTRILIISAFGRKWLTLSLPEPSGLASASNFSVFALRMKLTVSKGTAIHQSFYHRLCKWQPLTGKCGWAGFGINALHLERGMLRQQIFRGAIPDCQRSRTESKPRCPGWAWLCTWTTDLKGALE